MVDINLILVISICVFSIFLFYKYKLYSSEKHKTAIQLLIALNVIFTVYVLYSSMLIHEEEIVNVDATFYEKLLSGLWDEIQIIFMRNPKMNYFYDELYNGVDHSSYHKRDEYLEQMICFKILGKFTQYAEYYYSHIDLHKYAESLKSHNVKIIKIISNNLKSEVFRKYLYYYLNNFGGLMIMQWFKEFYNISPPSMENTNNAEYINNHPYTEINK